MRGHVPSHAPDTGDQGGRRKQRRGLSTGTPLKVAHRSLTDHLSTRTCFPGMLAGLKDDGKVPKADEERAVRATPEPPRFPRQGRRRTRQCQRRSSGPVVVGGVTTTQGVRESRTQGEAAIRSLEMAEMPGMRGRDRKVFDNLGPVEVQFLSPRCRGDTRSPRSRLIFNTESYTS
jgi:hypothetical protein